jgi:hypothetical protein
MHTASAEKLTKVLNDVAFPLGPRQLARVQLGVQALVGEVAAPRRTGRSRGPRVGTAELDGEMCVGIEHYVAGIEDDGAVAGGQDAAPEHSHITRCPVSAERGA